MAQGGSSIETGRAVPGAASTAGERADSRNQRWAFAVTGALLVLSIGAYAANELYLYLVAYLWFGFIYGMCLQGGRFCFSRPSATSSRWACPAWWWAS